MTPTFPGAEELPSTDPPEPDYKLFRHRNAAAMRTEGWHGLYWARRPASGDYEIRSVPTSLGEPSVPGGTMPAEPFERLYEKVGTGEEPA